MLRQLFVILLSFIAINIITLTFDASSDGYDVIGFPFVFYQQLGGKCFDCADIKFFKIHYLILDFIFTASIVFVIFLNYKTKK